MYNIPHIQKIRHLETQENLKDYNFNFCSFSSHLWDWQTGFTSGLAGDFSWNYKAPKSVTRVPCGSFSVTLIWKWRIKAFQRERKSYLSISLPPTSSPQRYDSLAAPVTHCHISRPENYPNTPIQQQTGGKERSEYMNRWCTSLRSLWIKASNKKHLEEHFSASIFLRSPAAFHSSVFRVIEQ